MEQIQESEQYLPGFLTGLSQERLKELLSYDPESGDFRWKISLSRRTRVGEMTGSRHYSGYIWIKIAGHSYPAHVLAWFYIYGTWIKPDHKDRDPSNNRLSNLRPATLSQQNHNKSVYASNMLGVKGVSQKGNRFEACIQVNHKYKFLGSFKTIEEASNAYQDAAKEFYGEFAYEDERQEKVRVMD